MWDDGRTHEEICEIVRMAHIAFGNRCRKIRTSDQYESKMAKLYDAGYRRALCNPEQPVAVKVRIKHHVDGYEEVVDLQSLALWCQTERKISKPIFHVIGVIVGETYVPLLHMTEGGDGQE